MKLILFTTSGCHLCEQAQDIVRQFPDLSIETIDIAESESWQARYAIRIPVLLHPETNQELGWPFGPTDVHAFIKALNHD